MRRANELFGSFARGVILGGALIIGFAFTPPAAQAAQFNLSIVDGDGNPFVGGFRYLVQEDCMFPIDPQAATPMPKGEPAVNFHPSHCHALQKGRLGGNGTAVLVTDLPDGMDCFVSVIPNDPQPGVQTGGARVPGCTGTVEVVVPNGPAFETSQISYKVFYDGNGGPLNGVYDAAEPGLAGWSIIVHDAAGLVQQDAFGNPLGTTYVFTDTNGNTEQDPGEPFVIVGGLPVIDVLGTGEIKTTCASVPGDCTGPGDGEGLIKYLAPGKYGIITVAPPGQNWYQTTTIEGTNVIDTWVAPGNGPLMAEFGGAGPHVFFGWTPSDFDQRADLEVDGDGSISGTVRRSHEDPWPAALNNPGPAFLAGQNGFCFVGVNAVSGAGGEAAAVSTCNADGEFTIGGLAPGLYQLVVWDKFLHIIFFFQTVEIPNPATAVQLGDVVTPMWFGWHEYNVFFDTNNNGIWDDGELAMADEPTDIRFRDGTIYQAFPTDSTGYVPYEEVFPFGAWQVAEVGFTRWKPTGATVINDVGGPVGGMEGGDPIFDYGEGKRTPSAEQVVSYPGNGSVGGPVLLQAFINNPGQNQRIDWGKQLWGFNQNGGIAGIVYNAATRAEDDPEVYGAEDWDSGIPDVQVALFVGRETNSGDERPQNINGINGIQQPDEDNWPLGFRDCTDANGDDLADGGCTPVGPGPEDIDRDGDGLFDYGDAIDVVWTDSWDASQPEGCDGAENLDASFGAAADKCMDGLTNWNEIKDGVFDGGYAFGAGTYTNPTGHFPSDLAEEQGLTFFNNYIRNNFTASDAGHLPGGDSGYVVQVYPPRSAKHNNNGMPIPIYQVSESQDKNVDFGPDFQPAPQALPEAVARCTGGEYVVPDFLALFPGVEAPLAGQTLKRCNQKFQYVASAGESVLANNAVVDFHLHTEVPLAAKAIGLLTDDLTTDFRQGNPNSNEKYTPPFRSVAFFDYAGHEVSRVYSSEYGKYNALLPATVSQSLPIPSGISPMMHRFCINHPGPLADGTYPDPTYDPRYTTTCYTIDFMPGRFSYLDTPIVRQAAFVGPLQAQTDCAQPDGTPVINNVTTSSHMGPVVIEGVTTSITITSQGLTQVPDPGSQTGTIPRDFGFGGSGTVRIGDYPVPASAVASWNNNQIVLNVPNTLPAAVVTGQLVVTRNDTLRSTATGVTLHINPAGTVHVVSPGPNQPIQAAVDAASNGDLILVTPGDYDENVIVYKEVILQGAGAPSTRINASPFSVDPGTPPALPETSDKLQRWKNKLAALDDMGVLGFLPGQNRQLLSQEAPGFLVIPSENVFASGDGFTAQIDGFNISGSDTGGAIFVNAYADGLTVSNNRAIGNSSQLGGGIRVGNPLTAGIEVLGGQQLSAADMEGVNPGITIAHNEVIQNASFTVGGGVALYTGADNYQVTNNQICGNFSRMGGGGISQLGRVGGLGAGAPGNGNPEDGVIRDNVIIFNEVFQGNEIGGGGGGIELSGETAAALGTPLTEGTGSITIDRNLFHGNLGGSAPGGAISLKGINGEDVANNGPSLSSQARWHRILVLNNLIENNVSGQWGAGINLADAVRVDVLHNTIARNDTASVAAAVRDPAGNLSDPQPSGLVAEVHSATLAAVMATQSAVGNGRVTYSHPRLLENNIFNRNRSYWLDLGVPDLIRPLNQHPGLGGIGNNQWDLGVVGVDACMRSQYSLLARTGAETPDACNYDDPADNNVIDLNAGFVSAAFNNLLAATAADEGGNDTQLYFTPLTTEGFDYHINPGSNAGGIALDQTGMYGNLGNPLAMDVDGEVRPQGTGPDAGADEVVDN